MLTEPPENNVFIVQLMPYSEKVGRIASDEVLLQLLNTKCIPVFLHSLEACPLLKSDLKSMDPLIWFLMKLFNTDDN